MRQIIMTYHYHTLFSWALLQVNYDSDHCHPSHISQIPPPTTLYLGQQSNAGRPSPATSPHPPASPLPTPAKLFEAGEM